MRFKIIVAVSAALAEGVAPRESSAMVHRRPGPPRVEVRTHRKRAAV
jgi:hypothetical protein